MKEDICKTCENPLVWRGNLLEGKLVCPVCETAAAAPLQGDEDDYYLSALSAIPDGFVKLLNEHGGKILEPAEYSVQYTLGTSDGKPVEYRHTSSARRSGRTTRMLEAALMCGQDCIVLFPQRQMFKYCIDILVDRYGCNLMSSRMLYVPEGTYIELFTVDEYRALMTGRPARTTFVDHTVREQRPW